MTHAPDAPRDPSGALSTPVRVDITVTTSRDAAATLPGLIPGQWTATANAFRYRSIGDVEHMTFCTMQARGRLAGEVTPSHDYVVQWLLGGEGTLNTGRSVHGAQQQPLLLPPDKPYSVDLLDPNQRSVHLRRRFVEAVAAERYLFQPGHLPFAYRTEPSSAAITRWWSTVDDAWQHMRDNTAGPARWIEHAIALAEALLDLYPPVAPLIPDTLQAPRHERLRAAVAFMHAQARAPLTLADVSAVAELSPRAVQQGFQRLLDCSPMQYLRQVRLDHVRADLILATPDETTVGDVARSWGFTHLGRFAAAYVDRFGEYPKNTLRS